jgi:hypothetical protein
MFFGNKIRLLEYKFMIIVILQSVEALRAVTLTQLLGQIEVVACVKSIVVQILSPNFHISAWPWAYSRGGPKTRILTL